ncbi:hypothetical protein BFN03_01985 [Rhodococcus sp. WMMA185]|uniref:SDR family NAD(P)-dependent oxidoreductase n=1 Tax=Rhodococcus sp. WMMA185 TaxID=679318 RepID=UPI000878E9C4|nr:SDR family NAD(P)-dependent oxidoreductase [Rhodococcus sp. WMMA185]AOW91875.1 hypothetical protein BFN03_01985 [Rhodococcus sp. WMMA185]
MADQKVILVTGASSGIGLASALALMRAGHVVYGGARRVALMNPIVAAGGHAISLDVTEDDSVQAAVDRVVAEQGRIDGVLANAGYCLLGPAELCSPEEVTRQFDTNVVGMARVISAVLPHLRRQRSGRVVITSSAAGHASVPNMGWYCATKHAQQAYGDALRMEVKEFGIQVVLIEPGYIATEIATASLPTLDLAEARPGADEYRKQMATLRTKFARSVNNGASPETIAQVVTRAFGARRPRRRYHPNLDARSAILLERTIGDVLIDRIVPRQSIR